MNQNFRHSQSVLSKVNKPRNGFPSCTTTVVQTYSYCQIILYACDKEQNYFRYRTVTIFSHLVVQLLKFHLLKKVIIVLNSVGIEHISVIPHGPFFTCKPWELAKKNKKPQLEIQKPKRYWEYTGQATSADRVDELRA